jgi:hypothetical protein
LIFKSSFDEKSKSKSSIKKDDNQNDSKRDDTKNNILIEEKCILKENNDTNKKIQIAQNFKETKNLKTISFTSKSRSTESLISGGGYVKRTAISDKQSKKKSKCRQIFSSQEIIAMV